MGWPGDGSHIGQGCQAWTAVGLVSSFSGNGDKHRLMGPWGSGKDFTFYYIQCRIGQFPVRSLVQQQNDLSSQWSSFSLLTMQQVHTWEPTIFQSMTCGSAELYVQMWNKSVWKRNSDAHCCHTSTAIKHPVPDRVEPSFAIFDIWALWR